MKKTIVALLAATMVFTMVGCGSNGTTTTTEAVSTVADTTVADTTVADTTIADTEDTTADAEATDPADGEATLGTTLGNLFLAEIENTTDLEAVANKLSEASEMDCMVMPVEEGFLNGFSSDVTGFKQGYVFAPMIGSIPMIGYVFETDDADALKQTLTDLADPRWNICTEAGETVVEVSGNYVFFTMCPGEDEYMEEELPDEMF